MLLTNRKKSENTLLCDKIYHERTKHCSRKRKLEISGTRVYQSQNTDKQGIGLKIPIQIFRI